MRGPAPRVLRLGDRIRLDGVAQTVTGLSGTSVRLTDENGRTSAVRLVDVFVQGEFEGAGRERRLAAGALAGLPEEVVAEARWWEGHVLEVLTGRGPDAAPHAPPRPQFDPQQWTLAQREAAKAAELAAGGRDGVSARTVKRKRLRYEASGLAGLVDGRADPSRPVGGRVDERVVSALRRAIEEAIDPSTRTAGYLRWKVEQICEAEHGPGAVPMPPRTTFYRLFERMSQGRHTTGSARTRRSMASRPPAPYGMFTVVRPGELMQIDSTPLDVAVRLDRGVVGRVELTGMIDVATRTVTAAVLRPTTKAVDASLLLARTVTPEPMRPGWSEALSMARSAFPHAHMLTIDDRLAVAAARPVIVPEVIVCDQGQAFISQNFRSSCQQLGIDLQAAHPGSPTEKPHIERMMNSVGTLFAQYVSGYLGSSVERRGYRPEAEPLWSLPALQDLLDEWIVAAWQNRPHDGLRDPLAPGRRFTPNEKYASLIEAAGYVPVALAADDYIELLPAVWRAINHYGVKIGHRVYDGEALNPLRRQRSGVTAKKNLWEVHYDPYDVGRVWVRNHHDGGWIILFWKQLSRTGQPFGELAWNHALAQLREQGKNPTETEIADAVTDLLARAARGPGPDTRASSARDRRVAARTVASSPAFPTPPDDPVDTVEPPGPTPQPLDTDDSDADTAGEVVPLAVFDAHEEARRWW